MKTPLLLLGGSLIFWGWQTELWFFAVIMAIMLEGARFVKIRWDVSLSDFTRISDLCTVVFLGMIVWLVFTREPTRIVFVALQWLPLSYFPLIVSQEYSTSRQVDIRALSLMLRKKGNKKGNKPAPVAINLAYPYFALCVLSASIANIRNIWFYSGLMLLAAWAIWPVRSERFSPVLWICMMTLAGFCGYAGHIGLNRLQLIVEQKGMEWFADFNRNDSDPYQSITAIGDIRELKLSDRILFRVRPEHGRKEPLLLREASYNTYKYSRWFALDAEFISVRPEHDKTTWKLRDGLEPLPGADRLITVSSHLRKGKGVLKLPRGTFQIEQLPVSVMEYNRFGAVKVDEGPGLANYRVRFRDSGRGLKRFPKFDSPPDVNDLFVPKGENPGIDKIIKELDIESEPPDEILRRVRDFFHNNFKYSLELRRSGHRTTPLADFLLQVRAGHCEYFASATVLILRRAGIPARYATGFSVHEFSRLENSFVVRDRDAHAWTLVYTDGAWQDFDTTASAWTDIQADAAPSWELISDLWSWIMFRFSKWWWSDEKISKTKHIAWLLIPLILFLARRLYTNKQIKRVKTGQAEKTGTLSCPGKDSEFYLAEKRLNDLGYVRYSGETLSGWIKRIEESDPHDVSVGPLYSILDIHYRYRFDPDGITPGEKSALKSGVHLWLSRFQNLKSQISNKSKS